MNKEDISGLMDGEVSAETCRELLEELGQDHESRRTWARYHLIGDLLRGSVAAPADAGRRQPLREIPRDAARPLPPHAAAATAIAAAPRYRRTPYASWAIAAGIGALAVTLVLREPGTVDSAAPQLTQGAVAEVAALAPTSLAVANVEPPPLPAVSFTNEQRMNGYLVNFNEQRARLGVPGVHPYVRIVGFEPR